MEILEDSLESLNFKEIKEKIAAIDVSLYEDTEKFSEIRAKLNNDKRKSVRLLSQKLLNEKEKIELEMKRVKLLYNFDKGFKGYKYIAGVDEVGRGPLAGPIVACAVILDLDVLDDEIILGLNDSKKVPVKRREELAKIIMEKAVAYKISACDSKDIDKRGISYCNNFIFLDSIKNLPTRPDLVLSDGYLVKNLNIDNKFVIKGDTKSASIAAASIVAKVYRDNLMKKYSEEYPQYGFESNVGYGSKEHIEALKIHGVCNIHRKSFLTKLL